MTIREQIEKRMKKGSPNSLYIVFSNDDEWYESLNLLRIFHFLLIPRFHGNIAEISEAEMNILGWYRK